MKKQMSAIVLFSMLFMAPRAFAMDCKKAASACEKAVCQSPELLQMDSALNHLYAELRPSLTKVAAIKLHTDQSAWLNAREQNCPDSAPSCLEIQYQNRIHQLQSLTASANTLDGLLDDATSVELKGSWKVATLETPGHPEPVPPEALQAALESAHLPALNSTVAATAGQWTFSAGTPTPVGWLQKTVADVQERRKLIQLFGLQPNAPVLVGGSGTKYSHYLFIPKKDSSLWAVFGICSADLQQCHLAAERWAPLSPDAAVYVDGKPIKLSE